MRFRNDFKHADKMTFPVMICDRHFKVIYKNEAAVSFIRLPKRTVSVLSHLDNSGSMLLKSVMESGKSCTIPLYTGDGIITAFVTEMNYKGKESSVWFFLPYYLEPVLSGCFSSLLFSMNKKSERISDIMKDVFENGLNRNNISKIRRLVKTLIGEERYSDLYSIKESAENIVKIAADCLREYNYTVDYNLDIKSEGYIKYLPIYFLLIHLITFICELTENESANINISDNGQGITIEAITSMSFSSFYCDNNCKPEDLLKISVGSDFDVVIIKSMLKELNASFSFDILNQSIDNVVVKIYVPAVSDFQDPTMIDVEKEKSDINSDSYSVLNGFMSLVKYKPQYNQVLNQNDL